MRRLTVNEEGEVFRIMPNPEPDDMDYGYAVPVSASELLAAARRFLSDDLIVDALEIAARTSEYTPRSLAQQLGRDGAG